MRHCLVDQIFGLLLGHWAGWRGNFRILYRKISVNDLNLSGTNIQWPLTIYKECQNCTPSSPLDRYTSWPWHQWEYPISKKYWFWNRYNSETTKTRGWHKNWTCFLNQGNSETTKTRGWNKNWTCFEKGMMWNRSWFGHNLQQSTELDGVDLVTFCIGRLNRSGSCMNQVSNDLLRIQVLPGGKLWPKIGQILMLS
jgi:hypothetical protein